LKITFNKFFAGLAVLLSVLAVIAGSPFSSQKSFVTPEQLADSLISRKQNIHIVDLRNPKDFNGYHIPSAINSNDGPEVINDFNKNDMIVFYSGRDNNSKTAQYNFNQAGFKKAYFLKGGIAGWMNKVLFPVLPKNSSEEEKKIFEKIERRSRYFGGTPEREGDNTKKVYRREGC
jgi:rhodanese-related sulfurtransferase